MKKKIVGIFIIFLLVGIVLPANAMFVFNSKQLYFRSVKTLYVGGDGPGNYSSINDAIENSSEGDTIFVYDDSSPYSELLTIEKSINLIGEDRNTTVIDGNCNGNVINIYVDSVNIRGFTIQNSGYEYGIYVYGLEIYSQDNIIEDNIIRSNDIGIYAESKFSIFKDNYLSNNHFGFGLVNSTKISIINNVISENYFGMGIINSNESTIKGNTISNTYDQGIFLLSADFNTISNNDISNNDCGMSISLCNSNIIKSNTIANNYYGLTIIDESSENTIYHNNFIDNLDIQALDSFDNTWDDGRYGNYWSDFKEKYPDAKKVPFKDIWNTPYEISGWANKDMYPLINQWPSSRSKSIFRFKYLLNDLKLE